MTPTRLPHRPFVELPPPQDGLLDVRRAARRRRRRRLTAVVSLTSVAATVVMVVALVGGSHGRDELRTVTPLVQPSATPGSTASMPTRASSPGGARTAVAGTAAPSTAAMPQPTSGTMPPQQQSEQAPYVQLVRSQSHYDSGSTVVCPSAESIDGNGQVQSSLGWCLTPIATHTSAGERLTVEVCRDSTTGGTLTFDTTQEVDVTVQRNGKTVWDWARTQQPRSYAHSLRTAADGCWDWTLVWPDISQNGASAGHGTFTFVATSMANEMTSRRSESTDFTA